ncbi:hypothetical protein MHU86_10981 [Fragilaria crotonensis]|nr:hypothetical protein MHU86_10981 [Fragilaria crotonensis]
MLASREYFNHSDDIFVIRANIDDSPSVEIPLIKLFDLATFTLVESYQHVLDDYVIELLEDTTWVDGPSFSRLLCAGYGVCREMETGRFQAMKRRDLQSFILQNLRNCNTNDCYFEVPLLIKFSVSNADLPRHHRRFKEPPCITPSSASRFVPNVLSNEESSMVNDVPYAVKDTDGNNPHITSATLTECVKLPGNEYCCKAPLSASTVCGAPTRFGIGQISSQHDCEAKKMGNLSIDDMVGVHIVIQEGMNGHVIAHTTANNTYGMSTNGNTNHPETPTRGRPQATLYRIAPTR